MKLMVPPKLAAPSSSVLNFLRSQVHNAFESSSAPCDAWKAQPCRYPSVRRFGEHSNIRTKGEGLARIRSGYQEKKSTALSRRITSTSIQCASYTTSISRTGTQRSLRTFSTTTADKIWHVFFGGGKRTHRTPLDTPLPRLGWGEDDLGRMTRPANELKMRCTEMDESGNVTMVSGEFKKSELIARYGLLPRDLRKIDSSLLPNILVRPTAILINLLHIRALIKYDRVLVFDAYGTRDSTSQSKFMYDLDSKLRQKESAPNGILAYEFRALEAVLISVTLSLEQEFEGVSKPVVRVLIDLEEDIDRDKLRYLLVYSKKLGTFEQKARLVRDALSELLEADDDLSAMYLTEKAAGRIRTDDDHTEVEMLLESYYKVADEIVQAAENLVSSIRNTEEIVKAILDANRNSLMLLDLRFTILTLAATAGTFVAALYGMNLKNFIEESDLGFTAVAALCTLSAAVIAAWGLRRLRSSQTLSMLGHATGVREAPPQLARRGRYGSGHGAAGGEMEEGAQPGVPRLKAGSLNALVHRERALAMRLSQAEERVEEAAEKRAKT